MSLFRPLSASMALVGLPSISYCRQVSGSNSSSHPIKPTSEVRVPVPVADVRRVFVNEHAMNAAATSQVLTNDDAYIFW